MHLIALGANLPGPYGPPAATLARAVEELNAAGLTVTALSAVYSTPAWPVGSGPDFANAAALLDTSLPPREVLAVLHGIEAELGRVRGQRWAARACDLDLLGSQDQVIPDIETVTHWMQLDTSVPPPAPDGLILPHPRLHERAFVLVPLSDIAPDWVHPVTLRSVRQMCAALPAADFASIRPI